MYRGWFGAWFLVVLGLWVQDVGGKGFRMPGFRV